MRTGIFGGSFDPIHNGHLILAEQCREQAGLDQVWFVPCAQQPLKKGKPQATNRQRAEMIEMAIAGHDAFRLSRIELERDEISYTVDTLEQIHAAHPDAQLFLLMGDDSLESFSQWRSPERICELAAPLVVKRPGCGAVDLNAVRPFVTPQRFDELKSWTITSPEIGISSSDLRSRLAAGKSVRYLIPRAVERYIETGRVYTR